jgi:ankyrin repeat protein
MLVPLWSTSKVTDNGTTPLHFASHEGHLAVVRLLLEAGAAKDVSNAHGATALHLAARRGHLEVVKVLLDFGAQQLAVSTRLKHVSLFSIPQTER